MILVPMWLFVLTLSAKGLTVIRGAWQAWCTHRRGKPVVVTSCLVAGYVTTTIGFVYYAWMLEPIGMLGHAYSFLLLTVNMFYRVKEIRCKK